MLNSRRLPKPRSLSALVALSLLSAASSALAAGGDSSCPSGKDFNRMVRGSTAADCEASEAKAYEEHPECVSDEFQLKVEAAKLNCVQLVMENTFDRRVAGLTKANPTEAKAERRIQMNFLAATRVGCHTLNHCEGQIYRIEESECLAHSYAWRADQIHAASKHNMTLNAKEADEDTNKLLDRVSSTGFGGYSWLLCQMPAMYWAGGKPPASCSTTAKLALLAQLGDDCEMKSEGHSKHARTLSPTSPASPSPDASPSAK